MGHLRAGPDRVGSDRIGSDRIGSDRIGSGRIGSGRVGSDRIGSARVGSGRVGSDPGATSGALDAQVSHLSGASGGRERVKKLMRLGRFLFVSRAAQRHSAISFRRKCKSLPLRSRRGPLEAREVALEALAGWIGWDWIRSGEFANSKGGQRRHSLDGTQGAPEADLRGSGVRQHSNRTGRAGDTDRALAAASCFWLLGQASLLRGRPNCSTGPLSICIQSALGPGICHREPQ